MSADISSRFSARKLAQDAGDPHRHRLPLIFIAVLLIHFSGLWLLMNPAVPVQQAEAPKPAEQVMILLGPRAPQPMPPQLPMAAPAPAPPKAQQRAVRPPRLARSTPVAPAPLSLPEVPALPDKPPVEDMLTQLEAARKRRADAAAALSVSAQQDDNSVARANVASSVRQVMGAGQDKNGGVFQIRHVGLRDAEFMFHGWSKNANRNSSRLVSVQQGASSDIQSAITQKMIDIIREQKSETFTWDSRRLNREVTLSARIEDNAELQRFLMREFFDDAARRIR